MHRPNLQENTLIRERPFNLKGGGGGGGGGVMVFFSKKNILIPNVAEKNILILVEEKTKFDSEFLSYNLMLNSRKKIRALHDKKNKYSSSMLTEIKILNETKNHNPPPPPLQVKWSVPYRVIYTHCDYISLCLTMQATSSDAIHTTELI